MNDRVALGRITTGVPGLDEVLGGGLPELSFNLIAGGPGCGKTTLSHQIVFANANDGRKALYFTIAGEPPLKMLRYQQQFPFFDAAKINDSIRFVHLGKELVDGGLSKVLESVTRHVEQVGPAIVVVDSFRSLVRSDDDMGIQRFVQLMAINLASYQATTFLVGEYLEPETSSNPIFTVADGIVWLYQRVVGNSVVRQMQVMKIRGQKEMPGLHTFALTGNGVRVFPRNAKRKKPLESEAPSDARKKTGVRGLDAMLGGGIPVGYSMLVAGPSGSGKTTLATQFIAEGVRCQEPGVIAVFDRRLGDQLTRSEGLARLAGEGAVKVVYLRSLDLSVEEGFEEISETVIRSGAKRVVVDSLSAFELALAPAFREDFRESLYRLIRELTDLEVTVLLTVEVTDSFNELRLSPQGISFLTDGIILQRYVEIDSELRRLMTVVKVRGCQHSKDLREYQVTGKGIVVGETLKGYGAILTGAAQTLAGKQRPKQSRGR